MRATLICLAAVATALIGGIVVLLWWSLEEWRTS